MKLLLGYANSKEDPKGSDCFPQFREMHTCFSKYPQLFPAKDEDEDDEDAEGEEDNGESVKFDEDELKILNEIDSENESKNENNEKSAKDSKEAPQPESKPSSEKQQPKNNSPRKEAAGKLKESILPSPQPAVV